MIKRKLTPQELRRIRMAKGALSKYSLSGRTKKPRPITLRKIKGCEP